MMHGNDCLLISDTSSSGFWEYRFYFLPFPFFGAKDFPFLFPPFGLGLVRVIKVNGRFRMGPPSFLGHPNRTEPNLTEPNLRLGLGHPRTP